MKVPEEVALQRKASLVPTKACTIEESLGERMKAGNSMTATAPKKNQEEATSKLKLKGEIPTLAEPAKRPAAVANTDVKEADEKTPQRQNIAQRAAADGAAASTMKEDLAAAKDN